MFIYKYREHTMALFQRLSVTPNQTLPLVMTMTDDTRGLFIRFTDTLLEGIIWNRGCFGSLNAQSTKSLGTVDLYTLNSDISTKQAATQTQKIKFLKSCHITVNHQFALAVISYMYTIKCELKVNLRKMRSANGLYHCLIESVIGIDLVKARYVELRWPEVPPTLKVIAPQ